MPGSERLKRGPLPKIPVISRIDRRGLMERVTETAGLTQTEADHAIDAIGLAVGTWIEAMAKSLPRGTQACITLPGIGKIIMGYRNSPTNKWRLKHHIPQPPQTLAISIEPVPAVSRMISKENARIIAEAKPLVAAAVASARQSYHENRSRCALSARIFHAIGRLPRERVIALEATQNVDFILDILERHGVRDSLAESITQD